MFSRILNLRNLIFLSVRNHVKTRNLFVCHEFQQWGGGAHCTEIDFALSFGAVIVKMIYRGSPDSTNFGPPGDRTIAKIVLSGDCTEVRREF